MHKTEMRQKSLLKWMHQKPPPKKVRQNSSASKFSASKIIKNINASKFCASEITPSVSASYATLRQNSMSQNSRVIVPCVKCSVRHRPFSLIIIMKCKMTKLRGIIIRLKAPFFLSWIKNVWDKSHLRLCLCMQDLRVCNEIIDITALRGYAFEFITFKISLFVKKFACLSETLWKLWLS